MKMYSVLLILINYHSHTALKQLLQATLTESYIQEQRYYRSPEVNMPSGLSKRGQLTVYCTLNYKIYRNISKA